MNFDVGDRVVVIDHEYGFLVGQIGTVFDKPESHYLYVRFPCGSVYGFASEQLEKTYQLKRYLLFAGLEHYAKGGWKDLAGSFETLDDAEERGRNRIETGDEWFQVIDLYSGREVAKHGRAYGWDYED